MVRIKEERASTRKSLPASVREREREKRAMELPHTKTTEEVLEYFKVKEEDGLSGDEVDRQREKYGPNGWYRVGGGGGGGGSKGHVRVGA